MMSRLEDLEAPPCVSQQNNCVWKDLAQPILDGANENLAALEAFFNENDYEDAFRTINDNLDNYGVTIDIYPEDLLILRNQLVKVERFVENAESCVVPTSVFGAVDWALEQLDMSACNASTLLIGSALYVSALAF